MDKETKWRKDPLKRFKNMMNFNPKAPEDKDAIVYVTLPASFKEESTFSNKEYNNGYGVIPVEYSSGMKVSELLKTVCKDLSVDDGLYVLTFGNSDTPAHPDSEIEMLNCNDLYLKHKANLTIVLKSNDLAGGSQEDSKIAGRKRSNSVGSEGSGKSYERKVQTFHFSRPHAFQAFSAAFVELGNVVLQISEKYVLWCKTADLLEPLKFSVWDKTENCSVVDIGQEAPRIFGANPEETAYYKRMLTFKTPKKSLILLANDEKEKKGFINTLMFYSKMKKIFDLPPIQSDKERERELKEYGEIQSLLTSLERVQMRTKTLMSELEKKAQRMELLTSEIEKLKETSVKLVGEVYQNLDMNKVRYDQMRNNVKIHHGITESITEVKNKTDQSSKAFREKQNLIQVLKMEIENLYKTEVSKTAWMVLFQTLFLLGLIWFVYRILF